MKARLAIIHGDKPVYFAKHVNKEAGERLVRPVKYSQLVFTFGPNVASIRISPKGELLEDVAEAYYVRDYYGYVRERYAVARYLSEKKCNIYNRDIAKNEPLSKLEQVIAFSFAGLPVPLTLFSNDLKNIKNLPRFPRVVKVITGNSGRLNFLVHSEKELQAALKKTDNKALIQEYIENDGDYRVIIMYGKPAIAYRRLAPQDSGTHLNNVAQGAKRELIKDREVIKLAVKAAKVLKREFCGVDIIRDNNDGKLYLLEANFSAGMHVLNDGIDHSYFSEAVKMIRKHS